MNTKIEIGILVFFPILVGGAIYTLFGSPTLWVFDWYGFLGLSDLITVSRGILAEFRPIIPGWVLYSLPDGLWVYAYTSLMANIWRASKRSPVKLLWLSSGVLLAVSTEMAQLFGLLFGTFDFLDICFYIGGFLLALLSSAQVETEGIELCAN